MFSAPRLPDWREANKVLGELCVCYPLAQCHWHTEPDPKVYWALLHEQLLGLL